MKKRNNRLQKNQIGLSAFKTFPLANADERDPKTNAAIPSIDDVEEAKSWVDFNKK